METKQIDNFLTKLSSEDKIYLLERLKTLLFGSIKKNIELCPCCNQDNFVKNGTYKGVQKFKCRLSSKSFTYRTETVLSGVHDLDKLTQLVEMLGKGKFPTIRELSKELGISMQTAFDWRTKVMTAIYEDVELSNNIIEFDETNFRLSRKGRKGMDQKYTRKRGKKLVGDNNYNVKVFISFSRTTKKVEMFASHMGRTSSDDVANYLGTKKDIVVYSDKHQSYNKFYNDYGVVNETFKSSNHVSLTNNKVHNQNINRISGGLGSFVNDQLRGVSTKYLQGYLNFQMFVINSKEDSEIKSKVIENKVALEVFRQKEREFKYFLRNNGRNDYGTYNDRYYKVSA